jgi:hypothetical protein
MSYPSYENVVGRAGAECVASVRIGSYQGDYYMIVKKDGLYGWIDGSYGSCGGCDEIEAAYDDERTLDEIGRRMVESVDWKTSTDLAEWIDSRDWIAQPGWIGDEVTERRDAVKTLRDALIAVAAEGERHGR